MFGGRNLTCQRVDQPESLGRFDVRMDCLSENSDASNKAVMCNPASLFPADRCAATTQAQCDSNPLCRWVPAVMDAMGGVTMKERCVVRAVVAEQGQFKTPSLRNIALSYPYMHNGSLFDYGPAERGMTSADDATPHLRKVVEFYNQGGGTPAFGTLDSQIHPLRLTPAEIDDVVEFLKSLTDNSLAKDNVGGLAVPPADLQDLSDCPQ